MATTATKPAAKAATARLSNIDVLRGLVMMVMCIDHARDYTMFHPADPMVLADTPPDVFVFRVLAHMCAPTFVFLAGISIWLSGWRKEKGALWRHLLSRGAILCLLEVTVVNWAWSFNPAFRILYLQIIWATGIAMMAMAALIHVPRGALAALCGAVLLLHNLLDGVHFQEGTFMHYLWSFLLQKNLLPLGGEMMARTTYPVLPVIAVMGLGYVAGQCYTHLGAAQRKKRLMAASVAMLALFVVFRVFLGFGDSSPVISGEGAAVWLMSVLNTTKYPLSLDFVLLYLSLPVLFLALTDGRQLRGITLTLGRVPMFFYILHLYVLHTIILLWLLWHGVDIDLRSHLGGVPADVGYTMGEMLAAVAATIAILYWPCRWYHNVKRSRRYRITRYI